MVRFLGLASLLMLGTGIGWGFRVWNADRDLRQARAAVRQHRWDLAEAEFQRHLSRFPNDAAARLEFAQLLKRRSPELALMELRAIPEDAPEMPAAAREAAAINLELGRDYDAQGPLLYLKERFPNDAGVELSLAEIDFRARKFAAALQHARRCRELEPNLPGAYLIAAEALDELKRYQEMTEPLEAVLELDPELPQARLNLAYALQLTGRTQEALEHVQWHLSRHPNTAAAHRILALVERDRGRIPEALAAVQHSLQLQPHDLRAGLLEGELLLSLNRSEDAHRRLSELAEYFGDEQRLLTLRIEAAAESGRTDEAETLRARLKRITASESSGS